MPGVYSEFWFPFRLFRLCGGFFGSKVWHSTDPYRTVIWQCNRKFDDGNAPCRTPHLKEEDIKKRFLAAYNRLIEDKEKYASACRTVKNVLTDTMAIDAELESLRNEMEVVSELTRKCIQENSASAQDQQAYVARYNGYVARYETAKARSDRLAGEREERLAKAAAIDRFIETITIRDRMIDEFDNGLWLAVLEQAVVHEDGTIVFRFYNGTEIPG